MTKAHVNLQDLRRRLYIKAKTERPDTSVQYFPSAAYSYFSACLHRNCFL